MVPVAGAGRSFLIGCQGTRVGRRELAVFHDLAATLVESRDHLDVSRAQRAELDPGAPDSTGAVHPAEGGVTLALDGLQRSAHDLGRAIELDVNVGPLSDPLNDRPRSQGAIP
jgi:hypothetical protein